MAQRSISFRRTAARLLALRLLAGALSASHWSPQFLPIGEPYEALEWISAALEPLTRHDRFIRDLVRTLDPQAPPRPWNRSRSAKRELTRLAAAAKAFAARPKRRRKRRR